MPVKTDESSNIISHGFDSPILNLFSYPQRGCKKLAFFFTAPSGFLSVISQLRLRRTSP